MKSALPHKPLRVLIVSEFPYKGNIVGGVQSAVQILAEALSKLSAVEKVLVMSFNTEIDSDNVEQWNDKLTVHQVAGQRRLSLPTSSFYDFLKGKKIADAFRPDIVHGQGTGAHGDVASRLGYPNVMTIHGVGSFEAELRERKNKFIGPIRIWLTKRMINRGLQNTDAVISISEFDRHFCSRIGKSKVIGIPNAVRQEFFDEAESTSDSMHIIFAGLVIVRKNVAGIVRAFAKVKEQVPEAILDIAGPSPDKAYHEEVLRNITPQTRDAIRFHGNMSGPELSTLMKAASVSVLFSIYENLPVAIAEALALGKPVVSSRVGAVGEMIDDGVNGFLVESGNEEMLAEHLIRLLTDRQLRCEMGRKGRELARKKWTPASVAAATVDAYHSVLDASPHSNNGQGGTTS
ncbi:MAG: glycosyltransferase family 4 protein [bacterium]